MKLVFANRTYRLGETIALTMKLDARLDVLVREVRVDLVCEVNWLEMRTVMVPIGQQADTGAPPGLAGINMGTIIPKVVYDEHRELYIRDSVILSRDTRLQPGRTRTYQARMQIKPDPPDNAEKGTASWGLVAAIDVARARNVTTRQRVEVTLRDGPYPPTSG